MKINFTKRTIEGLKTPPQGKRVYYHDIKVRGLSLTITDKGTKIFYLTRWIEGKAERIRIGRFPDLSVENARTEAMKLNALIAKGANPADIARAKRQEMTLGELFEEYLTRHAKPLKKSWKDDVGRFKHVGKLAERKLSTIKTRDIQALYTELGRTGHPITANRLLALLRTMYNKAILWGFYEGRNPVVGIKHFPERPRERFLQASELPRFFKALAEEPNITARDYFLMSLLTGARRSNVLSMRWRDIDFDRKVWEIPETKAGRRHIIPLMDEAMEILKKRQDITGDSEFVFPGKGKDGHFKSPFRAWREILKRAEIQDLRIHDLRRTLGSWQVATGASLAIIGKTLDHSNVSTTAIYAKLELDPVRQAMEKAINAMFVVGGVRRSGEVVNLT